MMILKKILSFVLIVLLLLLDYAALDDITTGNEINYYLEYLILLASFSIFAIMIYKFFKDKK
ncbi:hypothetical protein C4561_01085 [candidate division WWE3 bacterium]|jgi:hypothetical protein|uniref:Uncharacterized protein n=1 Tax=candidate division WWE3 bacterium TaxID=2053526 RepID=A0A3A4ZFB1_UNCKA|nr:MAG: hypothetical protein C4561_01085 [candidate division WWE3 bacterium]